MSTVPDIRVTGITSSLDGVQQQVKYIEASGKNRPLLIALHTWGYDYTQDVSIEYFSRCAERNWHCIFPNFRGANTQPSACGSEYAVTDILDAVSWAQGRFSVDHRRIFLAGHSGGGHMALLVASRHPSLWTTVSVWSPISDLAQWYYESQERGLLSAQNLEKVCGGPPGYSPQVDAEYKKRSPLLSLWRAHIIPVNINTGIYDGQKQSPYGSGSVPVGQSICAFNKLVKGLGKESEIISEDVISFIESEQRIPDWFAQGKRGGLLSGRKIHLQCTVGLSQLTLFDGGHEILYDAVFDWFGKF